MAFAQQFIYLRLRHLMRWLYPVERDHTRRTAGSHYPVTAVTSRFVSDFGSNADDAVVIFSTVTAGTFKDVAATRTLATPGATSGAKTRSAVAALCGLLRIKIDIHWTDRTLAHFTATYRDLHFTS